MVTINVVRWDISGGSDKGGVGSPGCGDGPGCGDRAVWMVMVISCQDGRVMMLVVLLVLLVVVKTAIDSGDG